MITKEKISIIRWWEDEISVQELDERYEDLESGKDKGINTVELEKLFNTLRQKSFNKFH